MNYVYSRDYKRLYELLYVEKQDVFGSSNINNRENEDPYFRHYEMWRHDRDGINNGVFFDDYFKGNFEAFRRFCKRYDFAFIDPQSYTGKQDGKSYLSNETDSAGISVTESKER